MAEIEIMRSTSLESKDLFPNTMVPSSVKVYTKLVLPKEVYYQNGSQKVRCHKIFLMTAKEKGGTFVSRVKANDHGIELYVQHHELSDDSLFAHMTEVHRMEEGVTVVSRVKANDHGIELYVQHHELSDDSLFAHMTEVHRMEEGVMAAIGGRNPRHPYGGPEDHASRFRL